MSAVGKSGLWSQAAGFIGNVGVKSRAALMLATKREAILAVGEMKKGIRDQAPGGQTFQALSELTLAKRKAKEVKGTKALVRHGDLFRSIRAVGPIGGDTVFAGVLRTATGRNGQNLANVAAVQEFGQIMAVNVDKPGKGGKTTRDFFLALFLKGLISAPLKGTTRILIIEVPARPFVAPVLKKMEKGRQGRFLDVMAPAMGLSR